MRTKLLDVVVGALSSAITAVLKVRDQMKGDGASRAELDACVERVVRDVWPKPIGRTEPWHYVCESCQDTGLRMSVCRPGERCNGISWRTDGPHETPGKYKRLCAHGETDYEHVYGSPCWCALGRRFQLKQTGGDEDFTTSTKSKPKPAFQKWGR